MPIVVVAHYYLPQAGAPQARLSDISKGCAYRSREEGPVVPYAVHRPTSL
jgi:hypothetical protein